MLKKHTDKAETNKPGETTKEGKDKPKRNMATMRLEKDIQSYDVEKISFVKLQFPNEDSLQLINVIIEPQEESPYRKCKVTFQLTFPDTYPMDPPKIKCLNHLYHPNINYQGSVCLPLVREDYSPTVNLTMVICGLIFVMTYPNGQDALNPNIGDQMVKDPSMFYKIVDYTVEGRVFENKQYDRIRPAMQEEKTQGKWGKIMSWFKGE